MTFDDRIRATIAARNQPKLRPVNDSLSVRHTLHDADGNCVSFDIGTGEPTCYWPWELHENQAWKYVGALRWFHEVLGVTVYPMAMRGESE